MTFKERCEAIPNYVLKFSFSEKATKIWCNLSEGFDVTKQCQNLEADCTKFLWPSDKS